MTAHGATFTGIAWTAEESQAMDRWLVDERGFTIAQLMAAAAERLAAAARALIRERGLRSAVFLVGPGNNGGDAWLAAERVRAELPALPVRVWRPLDGDPPPPLDRHALLVDGLFGVGLCRPIEGAARAAVEHVNASDATVLAVDIPSGLHATSGEVLGVAVRAHRTLTFVGPKRGFLCGAGPGLVGAWRAVDIGFTAAEAGEWVARRRAAGASRD